MNLNQIPLQDYSKIIKVIGDNVKPNIAKVIIKTLNISKYSNILELGCGTAGDANYIVKKTGASVIGVDINEHVIKEASKFIPIVNFDVSISPYPFQSNSFDGVYFMNLLQLIIDKDTLFNEIYRILKNNGKLFLLITNKNQILERYINQYFPSLVSIEFQRHLFENELKKIIKNAGFNNIEKINIYFDECVINRSYLNRLKSGILSSLLCIDNEEREKGLKNLEDDILKFESESIFPKYKRIRTAIIAHKNKTQ